MGGYEGDDDVETLIRGTLGRLLFSGDEVKKAVRVISGGEQGRMLFGSLMLMKPNVLLMDEPTNHLDMESIGRSTGPREVQGHAGSSRTTASSSRRWQPASGKSGTAASSTIAATTRNTSRRRAWPKHRDQPALQIPAPAVRLAAGLPRRRRRRRR